MPDAEHRTPSPTPDLSVLLAYADAPLPGREAKRTEFVIATVIPEEALSETAQSTPSPHYVMDRISMNTQTDTEPQTVADGTQTTETKEPQPW